MYVRWLHICYWIILNIGGIVSYNILLLPYQWKSHYIQTERIALELIKRGHHITVVLPKTETYAHDITLDKILIDAGPGANDTLLMFCQRRISNKRKLKLDYALEHYCWQADIVMRMLNDTRVQTAAVAADFLFTDTGFVPAIALADVYRLPTFALSPWAFMTGMLSDWYGIPEYPSFMPLLAINAYTGSFVSSDIMSLKDRALNALLYIVTRISREHVISTCMAHLVNKYMRQSIADNWKQVGLVLVPADYAVEYPVALPPNVQVIGPLTVNEGHPLDADVDSVLTSSETSVILVNYGETFSFPNYNISELLMILLALKRTVIWRFNRDQFHALFTKHGCSLGMHCTADGVKRHCQSHQLLQANDKTPGCYVGNTLLDVREYSRYLIIENRLFIMDQFPQNDLMAHGKINVFLFHCGVNSLYESVYHGIPVICSPLFGDQWDAAGRVTTRNLGVVVKWDYLTSEVLQKQVEYVTTSEAIRASVMLASKRLRNRKQSSVQEAADIVERYMEFGNTSFMRPKGADMSYFQLFLLDVAFVVILCFFLIFQCLNYLKRIIVS